MLDVLELEKKWSRYHFKKIFPLYIISFTIVGFISVSTYLYIKFPNMLLNLFDKEIAQKEQPVIHEINKSIKSVSPPVQPLVKIDPQNILMPSFNFIYNLEDYVININNEQKIASINKEEPSSSQLDNKKPAQKNESKSKPKPKKESKPAPKPKKVAKVPAKPKPKPKPAATVPQKTKVTKIEPVQTIVIGDNKVLQDQEPQQALVQVASTNTSDDELRSVVKRFNSNRNPALSLFLAKKYYENRNFKESYVYAKETYNLNPNIEDGVLFYAQSSVKLGKTDDAIAKLQLYIKNSGSIKAKTLLYEIQKGTFK